MTGLDAGDVDPDPIRQFRRWYQEADDDAVAVATAGPGGEPSVRMVLLRGVDERGFVFYTSYRSAKAADLEANPRAALLFHWRPDRQVRVAGPVTRVEGEEADAYWRNRPRASQLSAWASHQSQPVPDRATLEAAVDEVRRRFEGREVPRPPEWGGYRVHPEQIELWHHRDDRLHDRIRYRRQGDSWRIERLQP